MALGCTNFYCIGFPPDSIVTSSRHIQNLNLAGKGHDIYEHCTLELLSDLCVSSGCSKDYSINKYSYHVPIGCYCKLCLY